MASGIATTKTVTHIQTYSAPAMVKNTTLVRMDSCDETGARVEGAWVKDTEPGTSDDESDADEYLYYLKKSTGKPATGKQANVNGQIYLFDNEGRMLYGWVAKTASGSDSIYEQIDLDDDNHSKRAVNDNDLEVYYCGDEDDGHAKKNKWTKT